jgi:two-component system, NarL family, response regulator NreC
VREDSDRTRQRDAELNNYGMEAGLDNAHTAAGRKAQTGRGAASGLAETIDSHMGELELLSDEVRKIGDMIRTSLDGDGSDHDKITLRQACDRLDKRVQKWIGQLRDDYNGLKKRFVRLNRRAPSDAPSNGVIRNVRKVILADSSMVYRRGMKQILDARPDMTIVGEANDIGKVGTLAAEKKAEIVIIHLGTAGTSEIAQIVNAKRQWPEARMLLIIPRTDPTILGRLVQCGANAYIHESVDEQKFSLALDKVVNGESYLSPAISEGLMEGWRRGEQQREKRTLTEREREVLTLVAQGKSSRTIAERLFISVHTVDRHRANMMAKLNLNKATDLVKYAIAQGLAGADGGDQTFE